MWHFDDLVIDVAARQVWFQGTELTLSPTEFTLLVLLARHPRVAISHEQIATQIWGTRGPTMWKSGRDAIAVHVHHLRCKLGPDGMRTIATVRGYGYRFDLLPSAPGQTQS